MMELHRHLYRNSLFIEPRCNTFISAAISVAATTAIGYGVTSALSPGAPSYPNTAADSAQMATTEAELLPQIRQMQAQAELGGTVVNPGYTSAGSSDAYRAGLQQQIQQIQGELNSQQTTLPGGGTVTVPDKYSTVSSQQWGQLQSQLQSLQQQLAATPAGSTIYKDANGNIVPQSQAVTDFSGMSQADITGQIQNQEVAGQLATEQQFDPQFIAQALAEEQQSNPQGVAARGDLYADIQKQLNNPPVSPVANEMERQAQEKVAAGSGLTPEEQAMLDTAVTQATGARGDGGTSPDFSNALTTGFAGTQRALANAGAGEQFIASGTTPDDIAFRANQQDIANLSQFYSGQTPQAQFKELSGASEGATPIAQSQPLPQTPQNAGQLGASAGVANYQQSVQQALNTPNEWMQGLTGTLNLANTLASTIPTGVPGA